MGVQRLALGLLMASLSLPVQATPVPRYGLLVFSSLCRDRMTSDLIGGRLVLVRLPLHDVGHLEWSDGSLSSAPLLDLRIDDKTSKISFRYLRDYDDASGKSNVMKSVTGTVDDESVGLALRNEKPFRLPRLRNIEQKLPICR